MVFENPVESPGDIRDGKRRKVLCLTPTLVNFPNLPVRILAHLRSDCHHPTIFSETCSAHHQHNGNQIA